MLNTIEIVTKQDILNFKLTKINNQTAFKNELNSIGYDQQQYQLEFTEHQIVFQNEDNIEEILINRIEIIKFNALSKLS